MVKTVVILLVLLVSSGCMAERLKQGTADKVELPQSCEEIQATFANSKSGVYTIYPSFLELEGSGVEVYCDLQTDGGGWTVIQRRAERTGLDIDFYRGWDEYVSGFGPLDGSHWLGLDIISQLTHDGDKEVQINLASWEGAERIAKYGYFRVSNAVEQYKLFATNYTGDAGDALSYHYGMSFTTKDRDNDARAQDNCAVMYNGAWWYANCYLANLNGVYSEGPGNSNLGVTYNPWLGNLYSLKRVEMKIRSKTFLPK